MTILYDDVLFLGVLLKWAVLGLVVGAVIVWVFALLDDLNDVIRLRLEKRRKARRPKVVKRTVQFEARDADDQKQQQKKIESVDGEEDDAGAANKKDD